MRSITSIMFSSSTSNWYDLVVENFDRTVYGRKNKANFWMKLAVENEKKKKKREKWAMNTEILN